MLTVPFCEAGGGVTKTPFKGPLPQRKACVLLPAHPGLHRGTGAHGTEVNTAVLQPGRGQREESHPFPAPFQGDTPLPTV